MGQIKRCPPRKERKRKEKKMDVAVHINIVYHKRFLSFISVVVTWIDVNTSELTELVVGLYVFLNRSTLTLIF